MRDALTGVRRGTGSALSTRPASSISTFTSTSISDAIMVRKLAGTLGCACRMGVAGTAVTAVVGAGIVGASTRELVATGFCTAAALCVGGGITGGEASEAPEAGPATGEGRAGDAEFTSAVRREVRANTVSVAVLPSSPVTSSRNWTLLLAGV